MGAGFIPAIKIFLTTTAVGKIIGTVLINIGLGVLSKALTRKPKTQAPPINVTVRNPVENRRLLFGTVRSGGAIVFYDVSGVGNKYLWYVIVYAGHQVADIRDVWAGTTRIADSAINGGASAGGEVTTGQFANKMWIDKHLGTSSQSVNSRIDTAFTSWGSNHRLRGNAYLVITMERDDKVYPNGAISDFTALIDGALLYDPRLDSTNGGSGSHRRDDPQTWAFTNIGSNPALQWRWYISGGSVINDSATRLIRYGMRESDGRIDDAAVAAAANECDEILSGGNAPPSGSQARYRCNIEVSTGETRREIIEHILASMAGTHVVSRGKHVVYAGAYDTPTHSFNESDLYGALEVDDTSDHTARYNAVAGICRDAGKDYIEQTTPFRTDSSYETQDGGKRIPIEIDLRGVTDGYQAQRLCEIKKRKSRMMRRVKLVGTLNLLKVALNETLNFSHTRYGWTNRVLRCLERQFEFTEEAGKVVLLCQQEASSVYTDMATGDYTTVSSVSSSYVTETPDAPLDFTATPIVDGILFQWKPPNVGSVGKFYKIYEYTSATPFSSATAIASNILGTTHTVPKSDTTVRYYWITAVDPATAVESTQAPNGNGIPGNALSVTAGFRATVSPASASGDLDQSSSGSSNSVTVTPINGVPTYTYSWARQSGSTNITANSTTSATTYFNVVNMNNLDVFTAVFRCTVTDSTGGTPLTTTVDVTVTFARNDSF